MSYPQHFLRGVSDPNYVVTGSNTVLAAAFYFNEQYVKEDWVENSICWEDDEKVIPLMLKQCKKDTSEIQFKAGLARVRSSKLNYINKLPAFRGLLSYERAALENNPYHGNLLLKKNTPKKVMQLIAAQIAGHVTGLINIEQNSSDF